MTDDHDPADLYKAIEELIPQPDAMETLTAPEVLRASAPLSESRDEWSTRAPASMTRARERRALVARLHAEGASLGEMALALEASRQRASQIVYALGLTMDGRVERRSAFHLERHGQVIRERFLSLRDDAQVARELGLPVRVIRDVVDATVPDPQLLRRRPHASTPRYSDVELVAVLREAASDVGQPMAHTAYHDWSGGRELAGGRAVPGPQTMWLRWGSWRAALLNAGLAANPRGGATSDVSRQQIIAAVVACWRDIGGAPSVEKYDDWAKVRTGVPGAATARKFVDGWLDAQLSAWEVVHRIRLERTDLPELEGQDADPEDPPEVQGISRGPMSGPGPSGRARNAARAAAGLATVEVRTGGVDYWPADETIEVQAAEIVPPDPEVVRASRRTHARLQNQVAAAVVAAGGKPLSPAADDPPFDLAWRRRDGTLAICEVKSAHDETLEDQLRVAFGQVLRYGAEARQISEEKVVCCIYVELEPDAVWRQVLAEHRVGLAWAPDPAALLNDLDNAVG